MRFLVDIYDALVHLLNSKSSNFPSCRYDVDIVIIELYCCILFVMKILDRRSQFPL